MIDPLVAATLPARHGFFTRAGGVSTGPYASLNGSLSGGDAPDTVLRNRALVAAALGVPAGHLLGLTQVHGTTVITATAPWAPGQGPAADALVTAQAGLGLCIVTADCAPVLFAAPGVIGAAHAGWRGAVAGVLEAAARAMQALGARDIVAAIGPCIAQTSYQVGADVPAAAGADAAAYFVPDPVEPGKFRFDLAGYCAHRLRRIGVAVEVLAADTCADPARFFSHRRRVLNGGGPIGHQMSAITQ